MNDRNVTLDDARAAIRGLGMGDMSVAQLVALRDYHKTIDAFASKAIAEAAQMLLNVKRGAQS